MDNHDTLLLTSSSLEIRENVRSILEENYNLLEAVNLQQTINLLQQNLDCVAAVLLDLDDLRNMDMDEEISSDMKKYQEKVPFVMISGEESPAVFFDALSHGVADVIPVNCEHHVFFRRVENIVELHLHKKYLEKVMKEQDSIQRHNNDAMVDALSSIIEYRSVESGQHILRIRRLTNVLLQEVSKSCPEYGLTEEIISIISSAAALHDIGKIAIPDAILTKPGKLTEDEWEIMESHALTGCKILESLHDMGNQEYLRYAHNICHYHHERWDGGGYPEGIAGDEIPICAQVVGLADVYDALVNKRVYKEAYSFETAANMILNGECGVFSPKLLECFKYVSGKFQEVATSYADGLSPKTETFDVILSDPVAEESIDSLNIIQAKYQSLLHYINVFAMEINMERKLYHLLYNPYPEFFALQEVSTLEEIEELILNHIVVPEEKDRMSNLIHYGIHQFLQQNLRKQSFLFRLRSKSAEGEELFEITLMRFGLSNIKSRNLTVLCRRVEKTGNIAVSGDHRESRYLPLDGTYCCQNDAGFTMVKMGDAVHSLAGYTPEDIEKQFSNQLIHLVYPKDRERLREAFRKQLAIGNRVQLEHRICCKDGRVVWVLNKSRLLVGEDGKEYLYCILVDTTEARKESEVLHKKLEQYEIILAQTENVLFEWDIHKDTISFSDTWQNLFGYNLTIDKVRDAFAEGVFFHPDDVTLMLDRIAALERGSDYEMLEVRVINSDGRYLWCRFRATAIRGPEGALQKVAGIIINIDQEKREEKVLQDRAERDALTKLYNKQTGRKMAEEYISQIQKNGGSCALLIIDLDNFKMINDQYGHMFGDVVLTQVSREIKKLFRVQDVIARIGGDEFMVLLRGIPDRALVEKRCMQLVGIFENLFKAQNYNLPLTCSIGIALAPEHGLSYHDLFLCADQALYQAKDKGKNTYVFYDGNNFQMRKKVVTAVNNRIDSDEEPGIADSNIVRYAFQRLYASKDVEASINDILEMVGQQMNVSRVYIFENSEDNKYCNNTYEWCNEGIEPEIHNLQGISYETDIPNYQKNFNEHGIFYCPDINHLPKDVYDIVAPQGIKSMLHCGFYDNGVFSGYIGFDECVNKRMWTKEQIEVLSYFSEMLSVFLQKKRAQEKIKRRMEELGSILDNQNAWIYIIDPDTCRLKYLNAKTKELASHVEVGMCCYKELRGFEERCKGCPALNIRKDRTKSSDITNDKFGIRVMAEATLIQWEGEESCLLTCRELSVE